MAIKIRRNINGDTRTADHIPTWNEFTESNKSHIHDVKRLMDFLAKCIRDSGEDHDWTKVTGAFSSMFYQDMIRTMHGDMNFTDGEWAHQHYFVNERHHLHRHVPDDVNLIDVLEMICDNVAAGLARSGSVREVSIDEDVLVKAFNNTVNLIIDECEVE